MKLEPWYASKWSKQTKTVKKKSIKLTCPFCLQSHRTLASAHVCALEVSKYGSHEMKAKFAYFEELWLARYGQVAKD
jgi:hypothetical protein